MRYMLDTDICIYLLNRKIPALRKRVQSLKPGSVVISTITEAELTFGLSKSQRSAQNRQALKELLTYIPALAFDSKAATTYGPLRTELELAGTPIAPFDTQIAAHALSIAATLVTNNEKHFSRVPGLQIENWAR